MSVFDSIFKTFIPLLFLLVCNTSIILLAAKERKKIRNLFNESKEIGNSFDTISHIELEFKRFDKIKDEINKINKSMEQVDNNFYCMRA